jgi:hypothetical protein
VQVEVDYDMIIYLAAGDDTCLWFKTDFGIKNYLTSFADLKTAYGMKKWIKFFIDNEERRKRMNYFLDCGAFGAFHSGVKITLYQYIDFCQKYGKYFQVVAALDVIGQAEATMNNYLDMRRAVDHPALIPTWHYSEPWEYLERYCKLSDYVAIGGIAKKSTSVIRPLVEKVFRVVPKDVKVHLFGMTGLPVMMQYGHLIESVDSSSWLAGRLYASIYDRVGKHRYVKGLHDKDTVSLLQYNVNRFMEMECDVNEVARKRLAGELEAMPTLKTRSNLQL